MVKLFWHPVRLKRRRQFKQSQSDKNVNEQNQAIISCADGDPNKKTDQHRVLSKPPADSGIASIRDSKLRLCHVISQ